MQLPNKTACTIILTAAFVVLIMLQIQSLCKKDVELPAQSPTEAVGLSEEQKKEGRPPIRLNIPDELLKIRSLGYGMVSIDGWEMLLSDVGAYEPTGFGSSDTELYCIAILIKNIPSLRQINVCFPEDEGIRDENVRNLRYLKQKESE
jgi:hypothetical protein